MVALAAATDASAAYWFKSPDNAITCGKFKTYGGWIACGRKGSRKTWMVNPSGPIQIFRSRYPSSSYGAHTLAYGNSVFAANGRIECDMLRYGVRCENSAHGFILTPYSSSRW
jgi:hypothetical protein